MKTKEIDTKKTTSIQLPPSFRNSKIYIVEGKDIVIIKKLQKPALGAVRQRLKALKGVISQAEINKEIQNYRQGK